MKYGITAYPTTVLLDRKGVVRYIGIGAGLEESENLEDTIKKVLEEDRNLAIKPRDPSETLSLLFGIAG